MKDNRKAMVMASFLGDSLALGVHWIYDTGRIVKEFGRVESLLAPRPDSYHPTKEKGGFTHYGDQAFVLLESVAARRGFHLDDFAARWIGLWKGNSGYLDQATKATLRNFSMGKGPEEAGSSSQDLAGAARIASLVSLYAEDTDSLVMASRAQTRMTHNNPLILDSAEFFARVAQRALKGENPVLAMTQVGEESFADSAILEWVEEGVRPQDGDSVKIIEGFGQSCHAEEAFPAVVHLIARHEEDLREALVQCVMAGGDSAGRAMIVGMVLAAYQGWDALPVEWVGDLKRSREIEELLRQIA